MTAPPPRFENLLAEREQRVLACVRKAREELSEPNVHDLRVACRRFDAALQMLEPSPAKLRKRVKKLRSLAGELRDLHVLRDFLETQATQWPILRKALRRLPDLIDDEAVRVARKLRKLKLKKLRLKDSGTVSEAALLASCAALKEAFQSSFGQEWHEVRVALKRYRYQAEMVQALGLDQPDLEDLKSWQDRLGKIHDLEVQADRLTKFGVPAFVDHLRAERDRLIAEL